MSRSVIVVSFILCILNSYSQNEANIWYFGDGAGLDFSSGTPVALTNGVINTEEGCSTIANASGELLFYTDGITVWNKDHLIMPNGYELFGHSSSTQSAVVIPKPGSPNIYYLFTSTNLATEHGVCYSEVDMDLDSGLGDVTSVKNELLLTPACEKISAVKKTNGEGYWVVIHGYNGNSFYCYSVTSAGISNSPIISNTGATVSEMFETLGYVKFSPDGTKLLSATYEDKVELFDFDLETGVISNPQLIHSGFANYGVEFSPSGNVAYVTTGDEYFLELYQYDLTDSDIPGTQVLLYTSPGVAQCLGALQLANDGKIYATVLDQNYVAVINDPEVLGTGCNFVLEGVSLGTGICKIGLPQFIQSYFNVGVNFQNTCLGETTLFSLTGSQDVVSIEWDFGDGNTSEEINPSHVYESTGTYTVTVTAVGPTQTVTKEREITIGEMPVAHSIENQVICGQENTLYDLSQNDEVLLGTQDTDIFDTAYFASQADADNHQNMLDDFSLPLGTSVLYGSVFNINNTSCRATTSFEVNLITQPLAGSVDNYVICETEPYDSIEEFDLSIKNEQVLDGQSGSEFSITYHSSQEDAESGLSPLPLLYTNDDPEETIYARIENNDSQDCYTTTSFQISVIQQPVIGTITDYAVCDDMSNDGVATFDLTQKDEDILGDLSPANYEVKYFYSLGDAENDLNEITAPIESGNETIYVSLQAVDNSLCKTVASFNIKVSALPVANSPQSIRTCDDTSLDGTEAFTLDNQTATILGNQSSDDFSVTYHLTQAEALNGEDPIAGVYYNTSNPQTIYVRVVNDENPDCVDTTSFDLVVDTLPFALQPNTMFQCGQTETGISFNLGTQTSEILGGQNEEDFSVSYYTSLANAQAAENAITVDYLNIVNPQEIYARVENVSNTACYAITSFELIVIPEPVVEMENTYGLCEGESITVAAPDGFDSYIWSTGDTAQSITISDAGQYSLTVTEENPNGSCSTSRDFSVVLSGEAVINEISIDDWTIDENVITVLTEGTGDYEFSIDGMNFQDSNRFTDLETGVYTVYVRDKNGCGIVDEQITLLNYPKFFTPNSDGQNDTWNIKFSNTTPRMMIYIFDRYGKLITSFKGGSPGWDGTFNNKPLPSTDYWFLIDREGKTYKGHFSLIR